MSAEECGWEKPGVPNQLLPSPTHLLQVHANVASVLGIHSEEERCRSKGLGAES